MTVVGTLEAELKADPAVWEAAMKRATESMEKLANKVEQSSQKIKATNKATEEAASALNKLQGSAKDLGERFSKVGAVTSGMGAAFSSAVPQMQGAVSAAAGLAQAFASGGPLLAGIALAGSAIAALASSWKDAQAAANEAVAAAEKRLADLDARVQRSADALEALRSGSSVEVIELRREEQSAIGDTKAAAAAFRDVVAKELGGKMPTMQTIEAMDGVTESGTRVAAAFRALETAAAIQRRVQEDLANVVLRSQAQGAIKPDTGGGASGGQVADDGISSYMRRMVEADNLYAANAEAANVLNRALLGIDDNVVQVSYGFQGLGDVLRDAEEEARKLAKAEEEKLKTMERNAAAAVSSIGSGNAGSLAAGALLPMAGTAIGTAVGGPAGAAVGGGVGSGLAALLGPLVDTLVEKLGVLTPVMDALGVVVSALAPIFGIIGAVAGLVAHVLEMLAPVILVVSEMLGAMVAPLLRIVETVLPLFLIGFAIAIPLIQFFGEQLVALVDVLDTYVLLPIARAATWLYNSVVDVVNMITSWINAIAGALGFDAIDIERMQRMDDPRSLSDMGIAGADLTRAVDDNTEELEEFNRSLTNLPAGFRYALTEYRVEAPDGRGGPGRRDMAGRGGSGSIIINGPINVTARNANVLEEIRRNMKQRGFPLGGPSGSTPSERN